MSGVVVVAEGKNFQNFGIAHQRLEYRDPIFQIVSAIKDDVVPRCFFVALLDISSCSGSVIGNFVFQSNVCFPAIVRTIFI